MNQFDQPADPAVIQERIEKILSRNEFRYDETDLFNFDLGAILEKLLEPFEAFGKMFERLSTFTAIFISVVLVLLLIAFIAHIIFSFYQAMKRPLDETIAPLSTLDHSVYVAEAERLAGSGNFVDASRKLFIAALTILEIRRNGKVRLDLTNCEYLATFHSAWVLSSLQIFVELIDGKWYRDHSFDLNDYQRCQGAYLHLKRRLEQETSC